MSAPHPFLGLTLRAQRAGAMSVCENLHHRATVLPLHIHESAFVSLTLGGGYTEHHRTRRVEHEPGSAAFHPPGEEHSVVIGNREVHCLNVDIPHQWVERVRDAGGGELELVHDRGGPLTWLATRLHEELTCWSAASPLITEGLVLEMLGAVAKIRCESGERMQPRWITRLDHLIREEFDRSLTVLELAERIGVHPVHLSRTWRRFRGCSVGQSVHRARVGAACRRIAAGAPSLADVALEVGFADQTHFSRVFKQLTGMTPGAYRTVYRRS